MVKQIESGAFQGAANLKDPMQRQVTGSSGMVAAAFPLASDAAIEMLRGGNAMDAAVAAAWALTVCEPSGPGLGGQTTMLVRLSTGRILVIDGHSHAPAAVCKKQVSRKQQLAGYRSCTIPTTPATLEYARQRYGRLPQALVMTPAIRIVENGYAITRLQRRQMRWCLHSLLASPATASLFLNHGRPFQAGSIFRQKELASTLGRLVEFGVDDFYQGAMARDIAEDMRRTGGLITEQDLSDCRSPVERDAVVIRFGFLYNNFLCTCKRRRHPYRLGSGCIPQSNIAPTLVLRRRQDESLPAFSQGDDASEPFLLLGAAGSRRITSAILQVISGVLDRGMSLEEAVKLPRIHGLLSRKVRSERPAASEPFLERLRQRFLKVAVKAPYSYSMGAVQAIQFGQDKTFIGMADPRRDGTAAGL